MNELSKIDFFQHSIMPQTRCAKPDVFNIYVLYQKCLESPNVSCTLSVFIVQCEMTDNQTYNLPEKLKFQPFNRYIVKGTWSISVDIWEEEIYIIYCETSRKKRPKRIFKINLHHFIYLVNNFNSINIGVFKSLHFDL